MSIAPGAARRLAGILAWGVMAVKRIAWGRGVWITKTRRSTKNAKREDQFRIAVVDNE